MYQVSILISGLIYAIAIGASSASEAACLAVRSMPEGIVVGYPQPMGA